MKTKISSSFLYCLLIVAIVFFVDIGSKWIVMNEMNLYQSIALIPCFALTYVHNTGAAFSLFSGQRWMLVLIAAAISLAILVMIYRNPQRKGENIAFALILGGALGNLFDRIYHGYVIDFFDFYIGNWHYPIFNVADCAICLGFVLFLIMQFKRRKKST